MRAEPALAASVMMEEIRLPIDDRGEKNVVMHVRVCRPNDGKSHPAVIINHGTPPGVPAERKHVVLQKCTSEAAEWFLRRGYAVVFPLRLGFGETGGRYTESTGQCDRDDFIRGGLEIAREVDWVVRYVVTRPDIAPKQAIVVGVSTGGWGTIAYDSIEHPNVAAFINFAGGRGGHHDGIKNNNCRPDQLIEAAGVFGKTVKTPMLWVYVKNDSFIGPELAEALYGSFSSSGGSAMFEQPAHFGRDGHNVFFGRNGSEIWGPLVSRYLKSQQMSRAE